MDQIFLTKTKFEFKLPNVRAVGIEMFWFICQNNGVPGPITILTSIIDIIGERIKSINQWYLGTKMSLKD